ncbi:DUF4183 domain-containing protein [Paenibacillus sp. PL2-23]|uniref:DUF4183 domain-containing protein n=1 Tax=Paenibacillus sp. PL2-23 TaxID=2100729 RepID=UPI0030F59B5E
MFVKGLNRRTYPSKRKSGCRKASNKRKRCKRRRRRPIIATYYYYALGDGEKRTFTMADAVDGYDSRIPKTRLISLTNVFVDGMLQAPQLYRVLSGRLTFQSDEPPPSNSQIIAQFILVK